MNRHYRDGFQRLILNDVYHIEEQLRDYDEHLYLMYNPNTDEHLIMDGLMETAVMKIPQIGFECLDSRVVWHMKKIHTANGFSAVKQLEAWEKEREREQQRKVEDMAYDYAKEMKDALNNAHTYGRVDGVQKYVSGVAI